MIELRDSGAYWSLAGLATTYRRSYFVGHGDGGAPFRETILPGAFGSATTGAHVELRIQHDWSGPVLASTSGKTMTFKDGTDGLTLGAALSKRDRNAQEVAPRIQSGALKSFSVGMVVVEDHWPATNERHVIKANLPEVSLCTQPCNDGAVVTDFRMETRSGVPPMEYRMVPLTWVTEDDAEPDVAVADTAVRTTPRRRPVLPANDTDMLLAKLFLHSR